MTYMLCRNRVESFAEWKAVFDANSGAARDAGLRLANIWRSVEEPNNVFLLFEIASIDKAREFISSPDAARTGRASGVVDGECHFVDNVEGD